WPFTATVTCPSVALAGTATLNRVVVAPGMTVADTREPFGPANVAELAVSVELQPVPINCPVPPINAADGVKLDSAGAAGDVLDELEGTRPTGGPGGGVTTETIALVPTPVPKSGLTTVTVRGVRAALVATSTTAAICDGDVYCTEFTVIPVPLNITPRG